MIAMNDAISAARSRDLRGRTKGARRGPTATSRDQAADREALACNSEDGETETESTISYWSMTAMSRFAGRTHSPPHLPVIGIYDRKPESCDLAIRASHVDNGATL